MINVNMTGWIKQVIQEKQVTAVPIMTHPGIEMKGYTVRRLSAMERLTLRLSWK